MAVRKNVVDKIILALNLPSEKDNHFSIIYLLVSKFVGFKDVCSGETNVIFITNPLNEDLQHPIHVKNIQLIDTIEQSKVFIHRPDIRYHYENYYEINKKIIFFINFLLYVPR